MNDYIIRITDDLRILSLAIVHPLFNPQGGVISPILANIYLIELDRAWIAGPHPTETNSICRQSFAHTSEYTNKHLGLMHSR